MNDDKLPNEEQNLDYEIPPEISSENPQNFSAKAQKDKFLG
jgi:hypothetical protein